VILCARKQLPIARSEYGTTKITTVSSNVSSKVRDGVWGGKRRVLKLFDGKGRTS
jgi:hypothetical protein